MSEMRVVEFTGSTGNRLIASEWVPQTTKPGRPAILFMHGGGQTRHSWQNAAAHMASMGLWTLTVDARGHGESEWVPDGDYTFARFRDDLRALADMLKEQTRGVPPVIVGASMGGISAMLAQELGSVDGGPLFSAIVLVDITPSMERSGVDRIIGFMSANVDRGFESVEAAADVIAAYLPNRKRPKSNAGLRKNLRERADGRWYWHWDPAFVKGVQSVESGSSERRDALIAAASKIDVPTLLVRGQQSELVSEEAVREFLELVPHAQFADVTGAGHMVAGDRNDVFADAVSDFLKAAVLKSSERA